MYFVIYEVEGETEYAHTDPRAIVNNGQPRRATANTMRAPQQFGLWNFKMGFQILMGKTELLRK